MATATADRETATYSLREVARMTGVSYPHATRLRKANRIPGELKGVGRNAKFSKATIDAWLAGGTAKVAEGGPDAKVSG